MFGVPCIVATTAYLAALGSLKQADPHCNVACGGRRIQRIYQTPQARVVRPAFRRHRMNRLDAKLAHGRNP